MNDDLSKLVITVLNGSFLLLLVRMTVNKLSELSDKINKLDLKFINELNALRIQLSKLEERVKALRREHLTEQINKE